MNWIRTRGPRTLGAVLVLAATGLLASGAAGSVSAGGKAGGTLTIALAEDPDALDPTLARTFVGRMVFLHMCEKLYDLNAKLEIVPQLAAAMPALSADKKTMTIRLRRGVRFNDGTPFNAQAVKISLDRHRNLRGSARASEISPITSVDTVGNYTVRLQLNARFSPLTAQLADRAGMIMSPKQLDALGDRFRVQPGVRGRLPLRQPHGRRPDRARQVAVLLRPQQGEAESDRVPDHHRHERPGREPALPRHRRPRSDRVDRPAGDPARQEPARGQVDVDRLPGDLDQRRQQERHRQAVRQRGHAARLQAVHPPGVRALARPQHDQPRRLRRHGRAWLPPGPAGEPVLRPEHQVPGPEHRPGTAAACSGQALRLRSRSG